MWTENDKAVVRERWPVCDDCVNVAYDMGIKSYEEQSTIMEELGQELEDHCCEAVDEPEIKCICGCRRGR